MIASETRVSKSRHAISKPVVQDAMKIRAGVRLGDLTGIRGRTSAPKAVRRDPSGSSLFQLRTSVAYKAAA